MLARANRVITAADFRFAVRRGQRVNALNMVVHVRETSLGKPTRFGFIITKAVGNAVTRNLVRRRLRAVCRALLSSCAPGRDIVVRVFPGLPEVSWDILHSEIADSLGRAVER